MNVYTRVFIYRLDIIYARLLLRALSESGNPPLVQVKRKGVRLFCWKTMRFLPRIQLIYFLYFCSWSKSYGIVIQIKPVQQ